MSKDPNNHSGILRPSLDCTVFFLLCTKYVIALEALQLTRLVYSLTAITLFVNCLTHNSLSLHLLKLYMQANYILIPYRRHCCEILVNLLMLANYLTPYHLSLLIMKLRTPHLNIIQILNSRLIYLHLFLNHFNSHFLN